MLCIDLPTLPAAQRQVVLAAACDALRPGAALEFSDDHDPAPLYFRLDRLHPGHFGWHYLLCGPQHWRVRITRLAPEATDGHANPSDRVGNS